MTPDALLFLLVLGLPLVLWIVASTRALARGFASRRWLPVPARVLRVTPILYRTFRLPLTLARVEYTYSVAGRTYTGTSLGSGAETTLPSLWPGPRRLAPGAEPLAYYDPSQPDRAVLYPGVGFHDWLALATPLITLGLLLRLLQAI